MLMYGGCSSEAGLGCWPIPTDTHCQQNHLQLDNKCILWEKTRDRVLLFSRHSEIHKHTHTHIHTHTHTHTHTMHAKKKKKAPHTPTPPPPHTHTYTHTHSTAI